MKSVKYIFLSFFQQYFLGTIGMLLAILFFVVATFRALSYDLSNPEEIYKVWLLYYFALLAMVYILSVHLKRMIKSNAAAMLPNYKQKLLSVSAICTILFFIFPVIVTYSQTFPLIATISIFMLSIGLIALLNFKFGESIINILIYIWILRSSYELLGFPVDRSIVTDLFSITNVPDQLILSILLIVLSLGVLFYFIRLYSTTSSTQAEEADGDNTDPWAKEHDKVNHYSFKKLNTRLLSTFPLISKKSSWGQIQKFQYSLFSPGYISLAFGLKIGYLLLYIVSYIYIMYGPQSFVSNDFVPLFVFIFYISTMFISTDFLQHRDRLSLIWVASSASSKSRFSLLVALTYFYVIFKQFIFTSLIYTVLFNFL